MKKKNEPYILRLGICVPRFNLLCLEKCWDLKMLKNLFLNRNADTTYLYRQLYELCGCRVLLPLLYILCLTPRQANHTENHFSSCEYSQTSARDIYKDMSSVSWEEIGVNHLNGSVNAITHHHHHTLISPNLKLLKPGNHLDKGWQTTHLKPNPRIFTQPAN